MNNKTEISWTIHNYCTGGCSYCPSKFWGGGIRHFDEYMSVAKKMIEHFNSMGRIINWKFDGGEPLEFFEFPMLLKLCKENGGTTTLSTNGGKLWLDWFAIEPNLDNLILTYHYWQNPNLINYIIQTFKSKSTTFKMMVPIRPDYFDEDWNRAELVQEMHNMHVEKTALYKSAEYMLGLLPYTENQLEKLFGKEWVDKNRGKQEETFKQKWVEILETSPSFTGKKCFAGIEKLKISAEGYISGSDCNNTNHGNIFKNFDLLKEPEPCKMQACTSIYDQKITKII
jgi:MoaA/NifB/PqqE/SkfB family radical SAM enzyme